VGDGDSDRKLARGNRPRDTPLAALAYSRAPLPEVTLEFLNGPSQATSRPVHRVMSLIGSASGCKFRLTDPSVSRFHASLLQTSAGLWIVDLLGHGGVLVNEKQVRFDRVVDGDILRLGRYQVRVRYRLRSHSVAPGVPSDLRHRALVGPLEHRQLASNSLPIRNWPAAAVPIEPRPEGVNGAALPVPIQPDSSSPKVEVMPLNMTLPGKFARRDGTESVLVPLVNQFGMMQQQMFDQFQHAVAMLIQMFGEMHRDQMEVIREELGRLHELTDEFNALKNELATRSGGSSPPISTGDFLNVTGSHQPAASESRPLMRSPLSEPQSAGNGPALNDAPGAQFPVPFPALIVPSVTAGQTDPLLLGSDQFATPLAAKSAPPACEMPAAPAPTRNQDTAQPAADSDRDTILWLHQRIMSLQQERESRWQKILKLLPGMS
jgi:hypothetical protein